MPTRSSYRFRLDGTVTLTLLLVSALALFVLAFRFKNSKPCYPISLTKDSVFYQDVPVFLQASAKEAKTFEWDFGDGGLTEPSSTSAAVHTYRQLGRFTVKVTVNGHCEEWKEVRIVARPIQVDKRLRFDLQVPDTAVVNVPVRFVDNTPEATSWEWRFGETDGVDNTNRIAMYMFKSPGPKEVYLKLNGRNDMATSRTVYVKPAPETKTAPPKLRPSGGGGGRPIINIKDTPQGPPNIVPIVDVKKAPEISSAVLGEMLKQVSSGRKSVGDFSEYLCGNPAIEVVYNGKQMPFAEMCAVIRKIGDEDDIRSVSVIQHKDENLCIKSLTVTFRLRGWLGKITH